MACDQESLKALELLMDEFFNYETTNERKRDIEIILSNFGQQQSSWKQCLFYLAQTNNSYVSMFCLTTLENILNKRWAGLETEDRLEIRSTLYRFVLENQKTTPNFIRNKLVKLVVDIARLSWPHFYPDFFTNVLSLAQNQDTIILCVIFLQTISEELVSSRSELCYTRKVELKRLLMQQVPSILSILTGFLESIIEKHKNGGTTTPPPSPTQGNHSPSPSRSALGPDMSLNGSLVSSMFQTLSNGTDSKMSKQCISLPLLEPESETIAALCLKCLTHLFSWIPLSNLITPQLLNAIFVFASLGTDPQHNKNNLNGRSCFSASLPDLSLSSNSVSVLAMSAVNEILSKNCIPLDFEDFLLQTFKNTFHLLQKLVYSEQGNSHQLEVLDPEYLDKFSDFLHLIVSLHLRRFEDKDQFPILEFLGLLFRYTFLQPNVDAYFSCLEVWSIFLDHLTAKFCSEDQAFIVKYEDALMALASGILHKIQLRLNQAELEELEHDLLDDACNLDDDVDSLFGDVLASGCVTEWQAFLGNNLEVVAKVADLYPDKVFALLYEPFNETAKVYLSLQSNVDPKGTKRSLNITSEHECKTVHCHLRDLSTSMQGIGRISILFLGENLSKRSSTAMQVISKLIEIANYSTAMKWFEVETAVSVLRQDLMEVHAQVLCSLRAWTHWLSQLYGQQFVHVFPGGTQTHQYQDTCHSINKQMLLAATNVLDCAPTDVLECGAPLLIVNCAIQLISSLSVLVRSPVALDLPSIQSRYSQTSSPFLDLKVQHGLRRSLVNFLLLPWPSFILDHKMELRKQHLAAFLHTLTKDFCSIDVSVLSADKAMQERNMAQIIETLTMIRIQIDELNGADKNSRETYYQCIKHFVQHTIAMFPAYVNHSEVCDEILSLFVVAIQVLRNQMGVTQVMAFVQTFLDIFTANHHLYLAVSESQPVAVKVVEKFLKLLELITCEPGQSFQRFVPNTIQLCMDNIYPSVADKTSPEIKGPLFKVLHCLMDRNWKFFFKSSVQSLGTNNWDLCEHEAQFTQIMQAFGQSFMQTDITIFKQNLSALESLNSRYKLYHKVVFRTSMLGQFITVLLQILVHKSHDILQEEIALTIYNMAAVDFEGFFCAFLTHFLQQTEGLTEDQKLALKNNFKPETDLPSFTQNNHRFVNDLRFYRICNDSLPQGTVKF